MEEICFILNVKFFAFQILVHLHSHFEKPDCRYLGLIYNTFVFISIKKRNTKLMIHGRI
ncbi:MAG: hypothetical protein ACI91R_001209 [Vicingaceae bacterium]|jgi:hypothetical protein